MSLAVDVYKALTDLPKKKNIADLKIMDAFESLTSMTLLHEVREGLCLVTRRPLTDEPR